MEEVLVSGVTANKKEAKVTICDVPDRPGVAAVIFKDLAKKDINVDMIIQNISRTGYTDVSFTVPVAELNKTKQVMGKIVKDIKAKGAIYNSDIAKVSIGRREPISRRSRLKNRILTKFPSRTKAPTLIRSRP